MDKYQVVLANKDGTISILTHNNRTAWSLRTAQGHAKDVRAGMRPGGVFSDIESVTFVKV